MPTSTILHTHTHTHTHTHLALTRSCIPAPQCPSHTPDRDPTPPAPGAAHTPVTPHGRQPVLHRMTTRSTPGYHIGPSTTLRAEFRLCGACPPLSSRPASSHRLAPSTPQLSRPRTTAILLPATPRTATTLCVAALHPSPALSSTSPRLSPITRFPLRRPRAASAGWNG